MSLGLGDTSESSAASTPYSGSVEPLRLVEQQAVVAEDAVDAGATRDPVLSGVAVDVVVLAVAEEVAAGHAVDHVVAALAVDEVAAADVRAER